MEELREEIEELRQVILLQQRDITHLDNIILESSMENQFIKFRTEMKASLKLISDTLTRIANK